MLVLSRKVGEQVVIGDDVHITVVAIRGNRVRLGFLAPGEVLIRREELCIEIAPVTEPDDTLAG